MEPGRIWGQGSQGGFGVREGVAFKDGTRKIVEPGIVWNQGEYGARKDVPGSILSLGIMAEKLWDKAGCGVMEDVEPGGV